MAAKRTACQELDGNAADLRSWRSHLVTCMPQRLTETLKGPLAVHDMLDEVCSRLQVTRSTLHLCRSFMKVATTQAITSGYNLRSYACGLMAGCCQAPQPRHVHMGAESALGVAGTSKLLLPVKLTQYGTCHSTLQLAGARWQSCTAALGQSTGDGWLAPSSATCI